MVDAREFSRDNLGAEMIVSKSVENKLESAGPERVKDEVVFKRLPRRINDPDSVCER